MGDWGNAMFKTTWFIVPPCSGMKLTANCGGDRHVVTGAERPPAEAVKQFM